MKTIKIKNYMGKDYNIRLNTYIANSLHDMSIENKLNFLCEFVSAFLEKDCNTLNDCKMLLNLLGSDDEVLKLNEN